MERRTTVYLLILSVMVFVFTGCGNDKGVGMQNTPSGVVSQFNGAILEREYREALGYTDTRAEDYELYEAWMRLMFDELRGSSLEVLSEERSVDGESASVKVRLTNGKTSDTLYTLTVLDEGVWKVQLTVNN